MSLLGSLAFPGDSVKKRRAEVLCFLLKEFLEQTKLPLEYILKTYPSNTLKGFCTNQISKFPR